MGRGARARVRWNRGSSRSSQRSRRVSGVAELALHSKEAGAGCLLGAVAPPSAGTESRAGVPTPPHVCPPCPAAAFYPTFPTSFLRSKRECVCVCVVRTIRPSNLPSVCPCNHPPISHLLPKDCKPAGPKKWGGKGHILPGLGRQTSERDASEFWTRGAA